MNKYIILCKVEITKHKNIPNGYFKYLLPLVFNHNHEINEDSDKLYNEIISFFRKNKNSIDYFTIRKINIKSVIIIDKKIEILTKGK